MKKLELRTSAYKAILAQFSRNLQQINYAKDTVYNATNSVKEYLCYAELYQLDIATTRELNTYFDYLQQRTNQKLDGSLSIAYLHKHRSMLKLFYQFLARTQNVQLPVFPVLEKPKSSPKVLSVQQVKALFKACDESLLGIRNKAVLAVYYGLGLRRKEGVQLMIEDLDFDREEVLITQSKTNRQRIVPMSEHVKAILEEYMFNVREKLVPENKTTAAVLVTDKGKPLSSESVSYIIRTLIAKAKITTPASTHTLRHSIATHLLESGMKLENIALFLGHKSLDSTQIYTHIQHA